MLGNCYFYVKSITFFTTMEFNKHIRISVDGVIPFVLGGLLIAYGIFRVIRAIVFIRRKDEE